MIEIEQTFRVKVNDKELVLTEHEAKQLYEKLKVKFNATYAPIHVPDQLKKA